MGSLARWLVVSIACGGGCFQDSVLPPGSGDDNSDGSNGSGESEDTSATSSPNTSAGPDPSTSSPTSTSTPPDESSGEVPADCGPLFNCVDAAPEGWSGPLLIGTGAGADDPPPCPPGLGREQILVQLPAPPASECDCSCGDPVDVTCASIATVSASTQASATCGDALIQMQSGAGCHDGDAAPWTAIASAGAFVTIGSGGSCNAEPTETIPPIEVARTLRVCAEGDGEPCSNGVCVRVPPDGGTYRRCIVREGPHVCPDAFSDPMTAFEGYVDGRDCSPCECMDPSTTCTPLLVVYSDDGCATKAATLGGDDCIDGVSIQSYEATHAIDGSCDPSDSSPIGSLQLNGLHSVCCLP